MFGDRRGTDETDRAHLRMIAERIDNGASTVDEIHDALREAGFLQKFKHAAHGERYTLGWLQDKSISARDGIGKKPEDDHCGKIEWRDSRDDSERLTNLHFIHAGRHVLQDVALHHHGDAAGDFHVLDAAAHFGFCFGKGLPIFESDQTREFVKIFFQQVFQLEQVLNALAGRSASPGWERIGSSLHGSVYVRGRGEGRTSE